MLLPSRFYNLISSPNLNGVKFHIILSTRSSFVLTFGRQLSGAPSSLFHCVCVSHHLSSHLCCLPHLIPQPLVATLSNHPKLPHDTLCVLLCNSVPSPHPAITSSIVHPQTQVSTPTVSSYCLSSAQPSRLVDNYLVYPLIVSLCEHHIIFQLIFVGCPTSYPSHLLSPITHHNLLH